MLSSQFFIICAALFARGFAVLDSDDDTLFIQQKRANVGIETDEHATWEARSNLASEGPTPTPTAPPTTTVDSCASATDLATLTSPHSDSTINAANTISSCGSGNERVFYYDLPAGESIHIAQTSNNFNSKQETRWGGSCPGLNSVQCSDDPDDRRHTWTNDQTSTQRVFFIVDGHGDFTIDWQLVSATPPAATDWYLGQQNASCDDVCSQVGRDCSEIGWPTSSGAFDAIYFGSSANRDANCSSSHNGRAGYNPAMHLGACFWDNVAASDRCGQKGGPKDRRFCPCVTGPTPPPTPTPTAPPTTTALPAPVLSDAPHHALQLAENSLGVAGGIMRFDDIMEDGTQLVMENVTEYTPFKPNITGLTAPNSSMAQISLGCGDKVEMVFSFLSASEPKRMDSFDFTVADLDKGAHERCAEMVEVVGYTNYSLYPSSSIQVEPGTQFLFIGTAGGNSADNPEDIETMTDEQKSKAVSFVIKNRETFTVLFSTTEPGVSSDDPDVVGYNGRRILFGFGTP